MRVVRARRAAIGVGACIVALSGGMPSLGQAQETTATSVNRLEEPRGELTLGRAIAAALARNPDLSASVYEIRAAEALIVQAGLRPNPELNAELENFGGTGDVRGARAVEATLSLSQVIELGGKRDLRVQVATADRDLASVELQAGQLDVLAEVTRRYIDVIAAQERLSLANANVELAQRTLDAISARVEAARSPRAEGNRAQIVLTKARLDLDSARSELQSARQSLAAMWGGNQPLFTAGRADLFGVDQVDGYEAAIGRLEASPDFLRFANQERLRQAELRLAQAQARPDMTLGLGIRRLQDSRDQALVAQFSMPLAIRNRNQGEIRAAELRREQTAKQRDAELVRVRATLFALHQQMVSARDRVRVLSQQAVPQAEAALQETQTGYDRGRFSFLELSTAQQDLLSLREAAIAAAKDYHQARAEIERLTSAPLNAGVQQDSP